MHENSLSTHDVFGCCEYGMIRYSLSVLSQYHLTANIKRTSREQDYFNLNIILFHVAIKIIRGKNCPAFTFHNEILFHNVQPTVCRDIGL